MKLIASWEGVEQADPRIELCVARGIIVRKVVRFWEADIPRIEMSPNGPKRTFEPFGSTADVAICPRDFYFTDNAPRYRSRLEPTPRPIPDCPARVRDLVRGFHPQATRSSLAICSCNAARSRPPLRFVSFNCRQMSPSVLTPATDSMASEEHTSRQPVSLIQTTPRGRFSVAQSTLIHTNPQGVGTIY
jgi:hypothetical protein